MPRSSASPPPKHGTPIPRSILSALRRSWSIRVAGGPSLQCRRPGRRHARRDLRRFECPAASSAIGFSARRTRSSSRPAACTSTTSTTCPSSPARPTSPTSARRVAHGTITSIDTAEAAGMPGVVGVFTAADLGLEPAPSPFNPTVARTLLASDRSATSASRSPPSSPRPASQADRRRRGRDRRLRRARGASSTSRPAMTSIDAHLRGRRQQRRVRLHGARHARRHRRRVLRRLRGHRRRAASSTSASPPARSRSAARRRRGSTAACTSGRRTQHAQGIKGVVRRQQRLERRPGPRHHARRRRRLRRQDRHATPRRSSSGAIGKRVGRPVRWTRDPQRDDDGARPRPGPGPVRHHRRQPRRQGHPLPAARAPGLPARFADMGTILAPFMTRPMSSGVYDIPNIECRTTSVVTNTTPTVAYRGAGRPEATAAIERAMDMFAAEIGMDPAEVRRKNLIAPFTEPHTTSIGQTYDVGDYVGALDQALEAAGYAAAARRAGSAAASPATPMQLGIGVSVYVEITGGVAPFGEHAKIEVHDDGTATIYTGTSPHGQGHDTAWSMIATSQTGIPIDKIDARLGRHRPRRRSATARWARARCSRAARPSTRPPSSWSTTAKKLAAQAARGRRGRRRARHGRRRVPRRRHAGRGQDVGRPGRRCRRGDGERADDRHPLRRRRARRSRSAPTSPSSRSTPRPAR